jgi:fructokinase
MHTYGAIEGGGTKFVCLIATDPENILAEIRIPTTSPNETLQKVIDFFSNGQKQFQLSLSTIGCASFGPVDLDPHSPHYGYITSTPKPGWKNTSVSPHISNALNIPVAFETDVNAAAIGEGTWGAGVSLTDFVYFTIGTGIGAGMIVASKPIHGLVHPEIGHIFLPHDLTRDPFPGCCPFHGDCFEGLACGPAILKRWGTLAENLPADHPAWELEANYIALALVNIICTLSPQRIILGGGVMQQSHLFPLIRQKLTDYLNGYVQSPAILNHMDQYIVPPALSGRAGVLGALALAMQYTP